jgi:DNA-binding NarL/FixJ family response regulator
VVAASDPRRAASGKLTVLVVDDDARVRRALRTLIESSPDLTVAGQAATATQALELDRQLTPDIVVLDLLLPAASNGLSALRELVRRGRPVVAISIAGGLHAPALSAGAGAFVEKGAREMDRLLDTIRAAPHRPPPHTAGT